MAQRQGILALDQGTTSSRAIVFDLQGRTIARAQQEFPQHYPMSGWVEHDPEALWQSTVDVGRTALAAAQSEGAEVLALGLTNQRETTIVWDRATGAPVHNAIVWQDRRTAGHCSALREQGCEPEVNARTGLLFDPYFAGTKIAWILDNVTGMRRRAEAGELAFGTVDSWLLWRLTGGRVHATDATNACRSLLFNIHSQQWDSELLKLLDVPRAMLPEVRDCAADFGETLPAVFGEPLPIRGVAGDQHAAVVGQTCFGPGMVKSTYGTGCFALLTTGDYPVQSQNRLLTTLAYRVNGQPAYALEGSIFVAGAAVQWLRDKLGVIGAAADTEWLAAGLHSTHGVHLVPAFTGLGAPYWEPEARGSLLGLSLDTGPAELARAALESTCFQTHDLITAMAGDAGTSPMALRADGGMAVNDWFLQRLADLTGLTVERPHTTETTAIGAAWLAGLGHGIWTSLEQLQAQWQVDTRFEPSLPAADREQCLDGWHDAVRRTLGRER